MSHGLNANMVHGWRKLARGPDVAVTRPAPSPAAVPAKHAAILPQFVPVTLTSTASTPAPADIQIELRRGATALKITWPVASAADCAAWMRELLR
jgi:transposase